MYGRVNPLQARLAGAWEDAKGAARRRWVVFSPERKSRGRGGRSASKTSGLKEAGPNPKQGK